MSKFAPAAPNPIAFITPSFCNKIHPTRCTELLSGYGPERMTSALKPSATYGDEPSRTTTIPRMKLIGFHTA